jgi:hypothetical protein
VRCTFVYRSHGLIDFLLLFAPAPFAQSLLIPSPNESQPAEIRFSTPAGSQIATTQAVSFNPVATVILNQSLLNGLPSESIPETVSNEIIERRLYDLGSRKSPWPLRNLPSIGAGGTDEFSIGAKFCESLGSPKRCEIYSCEKT